MAKYTREQLERARTVDLYDFLLRRHEGIIKREGKSIRMRDNHSLSIKQGFCGFLDFATGETGDAITLLTKHLGYGFAEAVIALSEGIGTVKPMEYGDREVEFPKATIGEYCNVYAFLRSRGVEHALIRWLIDNRLLYQDERRNAVFINRERTFCEIRGTGARFHSCRKKTSSNYWYFFSPNAGEKPKTAFICESAIDAISLYQLRRDNAFYIGLAGVANQKAIDRIKAMPLTVIGAFDNDEAGERARSKNSDIEHVLPRMKDWNDDLRSDIANRRREI